jgi:hypothetical protein
MRFPSSYVANAALNDIVSNVGSSHGVRLTGGSTGGVVESFGDDANVSLTVRGRGTGGVTIGNSSQAVSLPGASLSLSSPSLIFGSTAQIVVGSTAGVVVGSTAAALPIKGVFSTTVAWTHAAISSGQFGEIVIASSVCDISPGDMVFVAAGVVAPCANVGYRVSTAATSRLTIVLATPGSTATSTMSGTATITWFDLT